MTARIPRIYTAATVDDGVTISGNIAETAVAANNARAYIAITIRSKDAWVRLIPAAIDGATRKGIFVPKDGTYELPSNNPYTGEISIINDKNGQSPVFYVTEY